MLHCIKVGAIDVDVRMTVHFTYQGNVISNDARVSKDLDNRLSKASSSFGRLSKRVWQSHLLCHSMKIQVYRAIVIPPTCMVQRPGFSSRADQATSVSQTLLALHLWHQMARLLVKQRSPQESQPAQHIVHLASGAVALGRPRHKDERCTHTQNSLVNKR